MSVVLESKENNKAVFTVEVSQEDFQDAIKKAYAKNKSRFNVPGFRKGKVPMRVIEMNYGKEIFYEDIFKAESVGRSGFDDGFHFCDASFFGTCKRQS